MNWQPIETAPKDGEWILLASFLDHTIPVVEVSRWFDSNDPEKWDLTGWVTCKIERFNKPTHWSYIVQP
jgi:hypothetical protein